MMNCKIIQTGSIHTLHFVDPSTGVDDPEGLIGNYGKLDDEPNMDGFYWDNDRCVYLVSLDTYNWWSRVIQEQQGLEDRLHELRQQYGSEAVYAVIEDMPSVDLEDHATVLHRMLDEAFDDDALDLEEIRRTMARYGCTEEEAKKDLRGIISLWKAEDYFGSWTDEELGLTKDVDLFELEKKLEAEHPYDEAAGPDVPLEFVGLREYLAIRYQYFLDKLEDEE